MGSSGFDSAGKETGSTGRSSSLAISGSLRGITGSVLP